MLNIWRVGLGEVLKADVGNHSRPAHARLPSLEIRFIIIGCININSINLLNIYSQIILIWINLYDFFPNDNDLRGKCKNSPKPAKDESIPNGCFIVNNGP